MRGIRLLAVLLLVCLQIPAAAQEFSERQQIAIFKLSYYGQPERLPPPGLKVEVRGSRGSITLELRGTGDPRTDQLFIRALGAVDEQVRSAFINLGRFDVIGMEQRLTAQGVDEFIDVLTEFKQRQAELPEAVLLGQETFTEADFRRLVGGFVVVVPSVSWYSLNRLDSGDYRAEIESSFSFINVANLSTFAQFFVNTSGTNEDPEAAVREAASAISSELSFRLRSMPEFQIKTGVLEVDGREVILEFGRNMGLRPGDEYAILSTRVLSTGHLATSETGLIIISEVQEEFSVGRVLYAEPRAMVGDQLREVPRRGVELAGYLNSVTNGLDAVTYAVGARATASRGFFAIRPFAAVEVPIRGLIAQTLLPINVQLGGDWNHYFGRLKIAPSIAVGLGGAVSLAGDGETDTFLLTHLGGTAKATGSILVARDVQLFIDLGVALWASIYDNSITRLIEPLSSYGGLLIGGGVTVK